MRAVIGNGRRLDNNVTAVVNGKAHIHHLLRCFYIYNFNIRRRCKRAGACNKGYFCSAFCRCLCNGITHFAAATVAHITHRVNGFTRTGSSYQNTQIFHIATTSGKESFDKFHDLTRLRQTSRTRSTTGQKACRRGHHSYAMLFQAGNIFLRQSIFIHTCIHRRTDDDRCLSGQ